MKRAITVRGLVQGIGFRPFAAELAEDLGVKGTVLNSGGVVRIEAQAEGEAMDEFIRRLRLSSPEGAWITDIVVEELEKGDFSDFRIVPSEPAPDVRTPLLMPDLSICPDCLREMEDAEDRRHRYPFISCVACGPRYSILEELPYDREHITMRDYPMCALCREEYAGAVRDGHGRTEGGLSGQPRMRRRHAQTISCRDCGPQLLYLDLDGAAGESRSRAEQSGPAEGSDFLSGEEALDRMIERLKAGAVLAVKGIGGYQFVCRPDLPETVERLRLLKCRDKKPFAVMFADMEQLEEHCLAGEEERALLTSTARPVVLLKPTEGGGFIPQVSGESRFLGAFLPYTGLHRLLTAECGPLVVTSGNLTGEPIITRDEEIFSIRSPYLDGIAWNTRRIATPLDDSVMRLAAGRAQFMRRSRGEAPLPLSLPASAPRSLLCLGGDLKAAFCLASGDRAYVSQYFGDVEEYRAYRAFGENVRRMEGLLGLRPEVIVHDRHPGYLTSSLGEKMAAERGLPVLKIQHHHAHIGSVMAEHGLSGCIGVAFDGTGYGEDGSVWGGEFLLCRGARVERLGCLGQVELCGGDASAKDAAMTAACHLEAAGLPSEERFSPVRAALRARINTVSSSSMGRLFDAVAALLGIREENSYEGECAIALENAAARALEAGRSPAPLPFPVSWEDGLRKADRNRLIREIYRLRGERTKEELALGFHYAVARMTADMCAGLRESTGEGRVALSGGVFANSILLEQCVGLLEGKGFQVFVNEKAPFNDGGISLGQAYLAALMLAPAGESV